MMDFKVVERSPFARIARMVLKSKNVAMVLGKTVHLSGVSRETFLKDEGWVAHELCHIRQFREHGFFRFLWLYLVESMRVGYYNNKYEVEARKEGMKHRRHLNPSHKAARAIDPSGVPLPADSKRKH
ncbi:hypothetical protein CLV24_13425 [Pontibacter ummariensis]|uniref:DUF4157 domain-containing protein n=1 Tax=Pontibacter ummariensis TaxID=1610492 RepID=A0A239L0Q5_9BACT|nr:hypothetical protein [Pontibacter ummariensis]PRY04619.1 hypothetical protein CLV24_13425 [Pontibacter ummariensis]SNT24031.1 hypothetical protein SAMN06296052_13418 [Pontibacter ummariensis]